MPNGINDISPDLRDWLLNKNLILADSITNGGLASLAVGLGQQGQIETLPNAVQQSVGIVNNGQFYRDLNLLVNPYKSVNGNEEIDINTNTVINIGNLPPGTQPLGYQQNVGSNNPTSPFNVEADDAREQMLKNKYFDADYLYKVNLNTVFISPSSDGVYQFKQSLASRTVDALATALNLGGVAQQVGTIGPDSQLGTIGDQQIVKHFGYNAAFGLSQETLGHINLNPLSLLQGNDIFVPNYTLTVPKTALGSVADFGAKVLGFEIPVSLLDPSASIFSSENAVDNIARASAMIANTGKGQVLALIDNLNQNKFKPTITEDRKRISITKGDTGTNGELYAFEATEPGRILDLLNTTPKSAADNDIPPSEDEYTTAQDAPDKRGFEEKYGKITSELQGGFTDDFGDGPSDNVFEYGEDGSFVDKFTWGDKSNNKPGNRIFGDNAGSGFSTKSLLFKTQELFNTNKMKTVVSGKGVKGQVKGEVQSAVQFNHIPKGSGVLSQTALQPDAAELDLTAEDIFCRTWTTFDKYNQVQDLQKNRGLDTIAGSTIRKNTTNSVLDNNGFVRIGPYVTDADEEPAINGSTMKRFMFSIENLAWDGFSEFFLPKCEQGPGDPITGTKGRIMWFPPYGMNFTDNTSVDWTATDFIGRGEPIYTYNNTERTGTLQWQMIIDHATYINDLRDAGASDELFASIAAGCADLNGAIGDKLSQAEKDKIESAVVQKPEEIKIEPEKPPVQGFKMYFPNDVTAIPSNYENGDGTGLGSIMADAGYITEAVTGGVHPYDDNTDFALNGGKYDGKVGQLLSIDGSKDYEGWMDPDYQIDLANYLITKCPACEIQIGGYSSKDGEEETSANKRLSEDRAKNVETFLYGLLSLNNHPNLDNIFQPLKDESAVGEKDGAVDSWNKKTARYSSVEFVYKESRDKRYDAAPKPIVKDTTVQDLALSLKKRYFNECTYFEKLKQDDAFVYSSIKEKVKYFHPAFHSITPEGFNSRLNFLQQCTRQGPTIRDGVPTNLAFGTPPVCILRIGDFYHTKIIIDNIALSFDPLVWDLNPEGVGVQPMMCTVDMSFKFIGGSSLQGPINRLQNAVSYNFFANTEIYSDYADSIKISNDPEKPNTIVNGFNPNNFDIPEEDTSNADVNAAGLTNTDQPEIDQEARAEEDVAAAPPEEASGGGDEEILAHPNITVTMQSDGKLRLDVFDQDFPTLTKEYPVQFKLSNPAGAPINLGSGTISNTETRSTVISKNAWKSAFLQDKKDGDTLTFTAAINFDGKWLPSWTSYRIATRTCGGVDAGDLLTDEEYNPYKEDYDNDDC